MTIAAVLFALSPTIASAQFNTASPSTFSSELGVSVVPTYPGPHSNVYVSLSLYTGDLNSATISWYKDGKLVLNGKGETKYSFKTGAAGEKTQIEISVSLITGEAFSKTFSINPASVDLVWESNSYVPPFYQGKALNPAQGSLKIVAVPDFVKNGVRVSAKNLIYEWSNGSKVYDTASGYANNTLVINSSALGRGEDISVLVTDPTEGLAAQGSVSINPVPPEIVFYENNAYYGNIFNTAIKNIFDMKNADEVEVLAAPYFLSKDGNGSIQYDWRLNGQAIGGLQNSRTAVFRRPETGSGESSISLEIENLKRILQQASGGLTIKFNE